MENQTFYATISYNGKYYSVVIEEATRDLAYQKCKAEYPTAKIIALEKPYEGEVK